MVQFRFLVLAAAAAAASAKFDIHVRRQLEQFDRASVVVEFVGGNDAAIAAAEATFEQDQLLAEQPGAKASVLRTSLLQHAVETQGELEQLLNAKTRMIEFASQELFWIDNTRHIEDASEALLAKIAALPNVRAIRKPVVATLPIEPEFTIDAVDANMTAATEWGVSIIDAPAVWASGNKGRGVVVGGIDTGVRHTHEALAATWRKEYGWFDPTNKTPQPKDYHGHGSHTMGSSVGSNGIGVAPEASWIACAGCTSSGCPEAALTGCAQFVLCPTDTNGQNPKCELHAHVINNSWGSNDGASTFYADQIKAWRAAGIIPVFANGNAGPNCATVGTPGGSASVIGVGATASNDGLASFSSRGPTPDKRTKPDVSAPGKDVRSAKPTGDADYQLMSGTSMATPHVTGAVALYLSAHPRATFDDVFAAFTKTVDTAKLVPDNKNCGGLPDAKYPNNNYGFGRININKAVGGATPSPPSTPKPTPQPTTKPTAKPTPKPTAKPTAKPTTKPTTTRRPFAEVDGEPSN
ncbi:Aste57867_16145 [Aphanomyces stellatus]|uniref:subtilisin n=2 Tax=Aphanomyces stellatus TaxID=120398 RepID=A0A485L4T4_9STRA|nr:hypothetical protein As57867_016089 [Aphanomyces stellatus]VFT92925.1 Aste57867_16145 [Aphanomyces stellatus]